MIRRTCTALTWKMLRGGQGEKIACVTFEGHLNGHILATSDLWVINSQRRVRSKLCIEGRI